MIKSLVITHGKLGEELIRVAEKILEKKLDIDCMGFDWKEDGSVIINKLESYLNKNRKHQIIIFTDMFGGSPTNICLRHINPNVEVITGINLPGMLKYLTYKEKNMKFTELVKTIKNGTIEGINIIGEYLGEKKYD
jgi:mannose/fructose-specific phosphotransferase system component IIA